MSPQLLYYQSSTSFFPESVPIFPFTDTEKDSAVTMSSEAMDLIRGLKTNPPTGTALLKPRDQPMYGREGVTMGQHLDEFDEFRDEQGRSFDELVYAMLFEDDEQDKKDSLKTQHVDQETVPKISTSTDKDTNGRMLPNTRRYFKPS